MDQGWVGVWGSVGVDEARRRWPRKWDVVLKAEVRRREVAG
jgi:hypothetical protein